MPNDTEALAAKLRRLGGIDDLRANAIREVYQLSREIAGVVDAALGEPGAAEVTDVDQGRIDTLGHTLVASWRIDARGDTLVKFEIKSGGISPLKLKEGKAWTAHGQETALACWCLATRPLRFFDNILGGKVTADTWLYWVRADGESLRWGIFDPDNNRYVFDIEKIKGAILEVINKQIDTLIAERAPQ